MSKTPWTPGPWTVARNDTGAMTCVVGRWNDKPWTVALTDEDIPLVKNGQAEANARLIAAAPEMAELLQEISDEDGTVRIGRLDIIRAILVRIGAA